jgi:hypothetical protein
MADTTHKAGSVVIFCIDLWLTLPSSFLFASNRTQRALPPVPRCSSIKGYWSLLSTLPSKPGTSPGTTGQNKKALAAFLSGERAERENNNGPARRAPAARLDSLATALDNFKTSRAEIAGPSNKVGSEEQPSAPEEPAGGEMRAYSQKAMYYQVL